MCYLEQPRLAAMSVRVEKNHRSWRPHPLVTFKRIYRLWFILTYWYFSVSFAISTDPEVATNLTALAPNLASPVPANCTDCDTSATSPLAASSGVQLQWAPSAHQTSPPSPYALLKLYSRTHSAAVRDIQSAVIETTVSPTMSMVAMQDDEPSRVEHNDPYASSTITTAPTPKSTAFPVLGFGDFRYPEMPHENGDDDEDFVVEDKSTAEESNIANSNVAFTSSVNYDPDDIHVAFGDKKLDDAQMEDDNDESGFEGFDDTSAHFASGHFDSGEMGHVRHEQRRILITGDLQNMPPMPSETVFGMQQAPESNFQGCYCDHHYKITTTSASYAKHPSKRSAAANNSNISTDAPHNETTNQEPYPLRRIDQEDVFCHCIGESVTKVPSNFSLNVRKIVLKRIGLEVLEAGALQRYAKSLTEIYMTNLASLHLIEAAAFSHLPNLMTIYIKMAPALKFIPDGTFFGSIPKLMHLKIIHCGLEQMPLIYQAKSNRIITMIDFDNSRIRNLTTRSVNVRAESLNIEYNEIEFVGNHAFSESQIAKLSLKGNKKLVHLEELAFSGLRSLRELDLSQTSITKLPTAGLSVSLEILRIMDTFTLKVIPHIYNFEKLNEAYLTYPYHCCAFRFPANHNPAEYARMKDLFNNERYCNKSNKSSRPRRSALSTTWTSFTWLFEYITELLKSHFDLNLSRRKRFSESGFGYFLEPYSNHTSSNDSNVYGVTVFEDRNRSGDHSLTNVFGTIKEKTAKTDDAPDNSYEEPGKVDNTIVLPGKFGNPHTPISPKQELCGDIFSKKPVIRCYPTPDSFNPCEDVMGNIFLRFLVWVVVVAAVLGNLAVIIVLMSGRFTFNVSKFLMINLAIADLMMGVYLLFIAITDARTIGVYFNYAIDWQHGLGCKMAGGLTVFASVLSIFTLTIITLERWFAITFAIQLNRRLKLGLAVKVMFCGWIYAFMMAILPAYFGVNSYSKTSICLPMEHRTLVDNVYLITLLSINCFAFFLISACYGKMYISIISQKTRATRNDMTIAKRMALLVFTDFACWAPIAFFGLTAIAGYPLIDVPKSKFLLVTFYPLNSCANPFLYAIFTKQYRRDFFILVSRWGICKTQAMHYKGNAQRPHVNYYLKHHHRHHRANSHHDTSDLTPRANHFVKSNPGSIFSQLSCDGQNVHLYKYICKGHHHHHYCAAYKNHSTSGSGPTSTGGHYNHSHHSCSEADHSSDHEEQSDQPCCSKYASQECIDSKSGSVASLTADKNKAHRKHKRCHNAHHHHHHSHLRCRCQHRRHCHGHGRCDRNGKCGTTGNGQKDNEHSASCCHSAVFSTVNIYPELSSDNNNHRRHRGGHEMCETCSCRAENSSNDNELAGSSSKSSKKQNSANQNHHSNHDELGSHFREKNSSSSREHVHMMRTKECNNTGKLNGRVMYSRNKSIAVDTRNQSITPKIANKYSKPKRSLPFVSFIERFSIAKIGRRKSKAKNGTRGGCSVENECSSPYSSTSSSCHRHRCPHRCCSGQNLAVPSQVDVNERESSHGTTNRLPIEEQREILRQALQETTTVQEAVAVVEELSSGTRVSMGSSNSSKKTGLGVKPSPDGAPSPPAPTSKVNHYTQ